MKEQPLPPTAHNLPAHEISNPPFAEMDRDAVTYRICSYIYAVAVTGNKFSPLSMISMEFDCG
jgi:hypothetical protein